MALITKRELWHGRFEWLDSAGVGHGRYFSVTRESGKFVSWRRWHPRKRVPPPPPPPPPPKKKWVKAVVHYKGSRHGSYIIDGVVSRSCAADAVEEGKREVAARLDYLIGKHLGWPEWAEGLGFTIISTVEDDGVEEETVNATRITGGRR